MSVARRADTGPERLIRQALFARGLRYRLQRPVDFDRRRRIDIVFPRERVAVFVDGCFWHLCPDHSTWPRANADWWRAKLLRNQERDRDTVSRLEAAGWLVIRVWEHEDPVDASGRIEAAVRARRENRGAYES
jgi:DNA mismatch endonuclease (patch repair protein)